MSLSQLTGYSRMINAHKKSVRKGRPFLTEAGIAYIRQELLSSDNPAETEQHDLLPSWDGRQLWLGERLLKDFCRQPAPYQTRLVKAFEKQGWAVNYLKNGLAIVGGESPSIRRRRLHDTIKYLNHGLPAGTIRFRGDGTGKGVYWEFEIDGF